ncbi:MAG TPA: glycerol acyltransferase [Cytophagales bacterium]|nr:glycerol acyltransferase [Cytophagales bacterium]HAA19008.1 glycerol acyltransferase [Cytophagales bacterium]HAP61816.1 glycerol acyltransferase [Cytophagales bacterium]
MESWFVRFIGRLVIRLGGWTIEAGLPEGVKKAVLVSGPHTSNWDFIWSRFAMYSLGVGVKFTIKKEFMRFPFGPILRAMGAIPIDRSRPGAGQVGGQSSTDTIVDIFNEREYLYLIVTPEGTRDYAPNWKTGFYYVAQGANVPIFPAYLNYKNRTTGIGPRFEPTGDLDADIEALKDFYRDKQGRHPEKGIY